MQNWILYIWHGPNLALIGPTWQKWNKFWHLIGRQFFLFGYALVTPIPYLPIWDLTFLNNLFLPHFFFFEGPRFNNHWWIVYAFVQSICGITWAPTEKRHKVCWVEKARQNEHFAHDRVIAELNTMKQIPTPPPKKKKREKISLVWPCLRSSCVRRWCSMWVIHLFSWISYPFN